LQFLSSRLEITINDIEMVSLNESDATLEAYRSKIKGLTGDSAHRITFKERKKVAAFMQRLKDEIHDEQIYLYSTPLCESCGSVKVGLHHFLDRATELVVLNANAAYVISSDSGNCIDLTYDTEYSSDSGAACYMLTIRGDRYASKAKDA